jgi:hypothetical protein
MTIFRVPAGLVPDATAALGLLGLMHNVNTYGSVMASYASTGGVSLAAADVRRGVIQLNTGAGAGFNVTLPSTADILTAFSAKTTLPVDGQFFKPVFIVNNNIGQTGTLVAGDAMTTIGGTATFATNVTRLYMMRVLDSTIQFTNIGALTL